MNPLTHFSLFSGIGGIDLAAEWAGFESVGQCEFADYPTKVLEKHWPEVPRWRDIRDVTLESVRDRGIRTIDLISGGFPCQPFSDAGRKKGKDDDRYLWPEMLRVIQELQSTWIIGENVTGIINMALEQVCVDLENEGYEVQPFIIPASAVEAHHQRKRVFIVAHANSERKLQPQGSIEELRRRTSHSSENVAYTNGERLQGGAQARNSGSKRENSNKQFTGCCQGRATWAIEPNVGRVANGISSRLDRLKCLGNAVVPAQVYPILRAIADIERGNDE